MLKTGENRGVLHKKRPINPLRWTFFPHRISWPGTYQARRFENILVAQYHPLITPMGRMRATFFDSPAAATTSTTSSTFLYAFGCSSARPL
jgi:hypothetical protein